MKFPANVGIHQTFGRHFGSRRTSEKRGDRAPDFRRSATALYRGAHAADSAWLIAVQLLDGVGAGIWGVLTPLVVADPMAGTGRYSFALGVVATAQGVGGSWSRYARDSRQIQE